jgi:hypothetical protein
MPVDGQIVRPGNPEYDIDALGAHGGDNGLAS